MQSRFMGRKTTRKTARKKTKKTAVQNFQAGEIVVIQKGAFAGKNAKIVRAARGGVIVAVAETFVKSLVGRKGGTVMGTRHRLVFVPNGTFEPREIFEPKSGHASMTYRERRVKGKKLARLLWLRGEKKRILALERELAEPGLSKKKTDQLRKKRQLIFAEGESGRKRAGQLRRELTNK